VDRDAQVLLERISGDTLKEVGDRHDLSIEGARLVILREARRHIDKLVLDMWVAQKQGTLLTLAIPAGFDDDGQQLAVHYLEWVLDQMAQRDDVDIRVHYRPGLDGSCAFALEDVDFRPTKGADR
jgi:hypothetical protein